MTQTLNSAETGPKKGFDFGDVLRRPAARAFIGLLLLWVIASIVSPRTMSVSSLIAMAPFIGILGIASLGQHLVIQQRGFDLSVAGSISLAAVIVTVFTPADSTVGQTILFVILALVASVLAGLVNGLFINRLRIPPLVMTIGLNALLIGFVFWLTNAAIHSAPEPLTLAVNKKVGGLSVLFAIFVVLSALTAWIVDRTRIGRRFVMTGVSPDAARSLGIRAGFYNIATYSIAGLFFGISGVMIAGLVVQPTLQSGNPYMLMTVAAVIVGGSPLNGDRGSVLATVIGAVFLVFLNQLVVSLGFDFAVQSMVQAVIILAGVTIPSLLQNARRTPAGPAVRKTETAAPEKAATIATADAILELKDVRKVFGSTVALNGVSFAAAPGEVHAIIGENGAGKSTLISIASGVLSATEGSVRIGDKMMQGSDPNVFRDAGISVAFQHPPLPPHLTVHECLTLAKPDITRDEAAALVSRVTVGSLGAEPDDRISDLSIGQRHVVEIARALASSPRILVLDEPTEPFKEDDVAHLFDLIRKLKSDGIAIIYISHRLHEVEDIADRISVLRDGELIDTQLASDFTRAQIIDMIVGRPLGQVFPDKMGSAADESTHFAVKNLSGAMFHDVSFDAHRGEIIGIAGVEGQGQRELMRALAGLEPHDGQIELGGQRMTLADRSRAWQNGVAFVPDDRHHEGLFLSMSVRENLGVGYRDEGGQPFIIDKAREKTVVADAIDALKIRTSSPDALVSSLSGGNQQKVLMGREIAAAPRVLLADEPTKGVDIGSKSDIYNKLRELARQGVTVIVSSSDGVELEGLCDRVLVMARGAVVKELTGAEVSDSEITAANLTAGETAAKRIKETSGPSTLAALLNSKWLPSIALSLASAVIIYFAASANIRFLSNYNLGNFQVQLATLAFIAFGQLCVMLLGEIDFSAGPMAGFVVVLASFWIPDGASPIMVLLGAILIIGVATLVGLFQGMLVVILNLPSIVVTLTGFFALQGISLSLRPLPTGSISYTLIDALTFRVGPVAAISLVSVVVCLIAERILYHNRLGRSLRASGSDRFAAEKLGVNRRRVVPIAFAINGFLVGIGGLILAATVGVGTGTAGVNFTLMSITAVVLGGTVISGGFGSFIAILFGAFLVQTTFSATAFMQAGVQWQYWLVGLSTLFAAALFSLGRSGGKAH